MKVYGNIIKKMDLENMQKLIEVSMKATGNQIKKMDKENILIQMDNLMKENIQMVYFLKIYLFINIYLNYKIDKKNGFGKYIWTNGEIYEGEYLNGT